MHGMNNLKIYQRFFVGSFCSCVACVIFILSIFLIAIRVFMILIVSSMGILTYRSFMSNVINLLEIARDCCNDVNHRGTRSSVLQMPQDHWLACSAFLLLGWPMVTFFIHSVVCFKTGPYLLPKRVLLHSAT